MTRDWSWLRRAGTYPKRAVLAIHRSVRGTNAALRGLGRRRLMWAAIGMIVVPAGVLVVLAGASMWWTSQPSFCNRCHPMEPYVRSWEASSHAEVNCEECHLQPGTIAFIGGKLASLQVVVDYFHGNFRDESFNAVVSNASCLECHADIENRQLVSDQIKVDHAGIIRLGSKCMSCHSTVAHGDVTPFGSRTTPTMATCFTCHDGTVAPTTCTTCHLPGDKRLPPKGTPGLPAGSN